MVQGNLEAESPAVWVDSWAGSDSVALWFEGESTSYAELANRVDEVATALAAAGIGVGDRVAWVGLNRVELIEALFACARIGAIFNPLNNRLTPGELATLLEAAEPSMVLTTDGFAETAGQAVSRAGIDVAVRDLDLEPLTSGDTADNTAVSIEPAAVDPEAPMLMVFTSGTTGRPKGAVLSRRAVQATVVNGVISQQLGADDVIIAPLPTFHVGGLNIQTLPTLCVGGTVVLMRRFDPAEVLGHIRDFRPTQSLLVPAMLAGVAGLPDFADADLTCFRGVMSGSSVVPEAVTEPWFERGVPIGQVYGTTETGPTAVVLDYDAAARHPGSAGRVVPPTELRVVGEGGDDVPAGSAGEIVLRGPNLFSEYWRDPEATAEALRGGWYHTGDVGQVDDDGWLTVSDRLRDMLISGGENVYPAEVESILADHPDIAEIAVIGAPDARLGEIGVAFVVPRDQAHPPTLDALRAWADDRLARYKHPRRLEIVDALPRTALGKVTKGVLRTRLG